MTARLAFLAVLGSASVAHAQGDDNFESRAAAARRVQRLDDVVWALTATCDSGDDTQQRQCRHVRDARAAELANATLLVEADRDAFDVGVWNPQKKSVPVTLSACIRCAGVEVDGKTWYLVGSAAAAPRFEGAKLVVGSLHDNARAFADEATASLWTRAVANVRIQLVVRVPAKPRSTVAGKNVIAFEVLAYRVFTSCDGAILEASPSSSAVPGNRKACGPITSETVAPDDGSTIAALTPPVIEEVMRPVVDAAHKCFGQFAVSGKATLKLTIFGDGTVGKYEQQGDFADTATGQCIDKAMAKIKFPHSKKPKTTINFPITLQQ